MQSSVTCKKESGRIDQEGQRALCGCVLGIKRLSCFVSHMKPSAGERKRGHRERTGKREKEEKERGEIKREKRKRG